MKKKLGKQSEAVNRIVAAMKPAAPEKALFYEEAGRAIVQLSNAENSLGVIFCILSLPVTVDRAKALFAEQGSLEKKIKIVDFMVLHSGDPDEQREWASIQKGLNAHRAVRNLIAHQRMLVQQCSNSRGTSPKRSKAIEWPHLRNRITAATRLLLVAKGQDPPIPPPGGAVDGAGHRFRL